MGKLISLLTSIALLATIVTSILIWALNKSTVYERAPQNEIPKMTQTP